MSGVYDTFDVRPEEIERVLGGPPADSRPEPGVFDTIGAGFRAARDENAYVQEDRLKDAYEPVFRAVSEATGKTRWHYKRALEAMNPFDHDFIDYDALWGDIAAARARDPKAFADVPKDRASFERGVLTRQGARAGDAGTLARGGGVAGFVGAIGSEFLDPVNLAATVATGGFSGLAGGGLRALGVGMAREAAINVVTEAVQTPGRIDARAALGEEMSNADIAFNLAAAAGFGVAVPAAAAAGRAGFERVVPFELRLARALDKAVPAELRTPEQAAAVHVLTRAGEVDQSNPFAETHAGLDAHAAKVEAVIADFHEPSTTVVAPRPADALTPREPGRFDMRGYLAKNRGAESGGDDAAAAATSSAYGRYQFTAGTWLQYYKRRFGGGLSDAAILAKRADGRVQDVLMGDLTADNAGQLRRAGVAVTDATAYLAHFLGPADAIRVLRAGADTAVGAVVRGASIAANRAVFDQAPTAGALLRWAERKMGQTPGETPTTLATADPDVPPVRPAALDAERPRVDYGGREVPLAQFAPADIGVDAALMQFKSGGDAAGVTERLRGVQQWDPIAAGTLTVWEGLDGRRLVADGHQRLGLARRLGAEQLNAFVLREADGFSAADARVLTALKNIGEGTGSAVDAAKVLRAVGVEQADEVMRRLPPRSALVRDGKDLARLSDEAFGAVVNEVIPDAYGAAIARYAPDSATHMALVDLLYRADPPNRRQAEAIVRQAVDAGFSREVQDELFGARELTTATIVQKARVIDKTLSELRKLKGAFSVAARNAEALDAAGNRIDVGASELAADGNARALALVEALALRKGNGVNALVTEATRRLIAGEPLASVVRDVVAGLRGLDLAKLEDDGRALADAGDAGDGPGGGGRAGELDREDPQDALAPADLDEIEAAQPLDGSALEPSLFGDSAPARALDETADVQAAADSVWHDIRAEQGATETVTPHISEQVGAALEAQGFTRKGNAFKKRIAGAAAAGQLSDGGRVVTLQIDDTGRYLERLDGFDVANDIDLRDFAGDPEGAVRTVLGERVDPALAGRQRQQAALGAAAPLRAKAGQDGTMGAPLFDAADEPKFDLGDGRGERKLSEISDELDQFDLGIAAIKECL